MRHRKSWARSSSVGALKLVIRTPCGSTRPIVWRSTPPLPLVSMPCSTSSTRRSLPTVRSAQSRSCRSASSSPIAKSAALPSAFLPSNPGAASVSIAVRSTGPGGRRRASAIAEVVMGTSWPTPLVRSAQHAAYVERAADDRGDRAVALRLVEPRALHEAGLVEDPQGRGVARGRVRRSTPMRPGTGVVRPASTSRGSAPRGRGPTHAGSPIA